MFYCLPSGDFDDPQADLQQIQVNGGECDGDFESRAEEMVHSGRSPASINSNEPSSFSELAGLSSHKSPRSSSMRKRKACHSENITGSPYKMQLEQAMQNVKKKIVNRQPGNVTQNPKEVRSKLGRIKKQSHTDDVQTGIGLSEDSTPCIFCEIPYNRSSVSWWQCNKCKKWVCGNCACVTGKNKTFNCGQC